MKRILILLFVFTSVFTFPIEAMAAEKVLEIKNAKIAKDLVISGFYDTLSIVGTEIGGNIILAEAASQITINIDELSTTEGIIVNRSASIENNGQIAMMRIVAPTIVTGQGDIQKALIEAKADIDNSFSMILIKTAEMPELHGNEGVVYLNDTRIDGGIPHAYEGGNEILGEYFFIRSDRIIKAGFVENEEGIRYYDDQGIMLTGLQTIDEGQYYFDEKGLMSTGLKSIEEAWYYFNENGQMSTGIQYIDGTQHYFGEKGQMMIGLQSIDDSQYYFNENGQMQTGFIMIDEKEYFFDSEGKMQTGLQDVGEQKYFFLDEGGIAKNQIIGDYKADNTGALFYRLTGREALDIEAEKILSGLINDSMTEDEKLRAVYRWPVSHISYRSIYVDVSNGMDETLVYDLAEYVAGTRKGSCEHYASLMYVIYQHMGYEVEIIPGVGLISGLPHVWVKLKIDGEWYHFDSQFESTYLKGQHWAAFKKTDEEFRINHSW